MHHQQTIRKLKNLLHQYLGRGLEEVIIFGSTARGTATDMSDIDVMIIVNDTCKKPDGQLKSAIRSETYFLELEDNVIFDLKVIRKQDLQGIHGHTPFMENVLREGIPV